MKASDPDAEDDSSEAQELLDCIQNSMEENGGTVLYGWLNKWLM